MILADVFPVFCPRVIYPSSTNQWPRSSKRLELTQEKMWPRRDRNQPMPSQFTDQYLRRHHVPEKLYFEREPYRFSFSTSSPKAGQSNIQTFSEPGPFRRSTIPGNFRQPLYGPSKSNAPMPDRLPEFLSTSSNFRPTSTVTGGSFIPKEVPYSTPLLKRNADVRESFISPRYENHVQGQLMPSQPFCTPRTSGILRKHNYSGTGNKKLYTCPQCKYVTDRKNNLKRHISTMHQDSNKILECCGMVFRSKALLRDHVSLFHRAGYRCQYCGRNFCRKALLRRHLTVHSGQKDYTCPQCGYATSHKSNLERHRKIHDRKFSLNGEAFSDDDEGNEDVHYQHDVSSPGSSTDSSQTESPAKGQIPLETRLYEESVSKTYRGAMPDRIRETHISGETTLCSVSPRSESFMANSSTWEKEDISVTETDKEVYSANLPTKKKLRSLLSSSIYKVDLEHNTFLWQQETKKPFKRRFDSGSSNRLFLHPYKCCHCFSVFSSQPDLMAHTCRSGTEKLLTPSITLDEMRTKRVKLSSEENLERVAPVYQNDVGHIAEYAGRVAPVVIINDAHDNAKIIDCCFKQSCVDAKIMNSFDELESNAIKCDKASDWLGKHTDKREPNVDATCVNAGKTRTSSETQDVDADNPRMICDKLDAVDRSAGILETCDKMVDGHGKPNSSKEEPYPEINAKLFGGRIYSEEIIEAGRNKVISSPTPKHTRSSAKTAPTKAKTCAVDKVNVKESLSLSNVGLTEENAGFTTLSKTNDINGNIETNSYQIPYTVKRKRFKKF